MSLYSDVPLRLASKPSTGPDCAEVERLALRHAVDDVEQDDVAQFLERDQMRQRSADLPRPDESDLLARHEPPSPSMCWKLARSS